MLMVAGLPKPQLLSMLGVSLYTPVFFTRSFTHLPLLSTDAGAPSYSCLGAAYARCGSAGCVLTSAGSSAAKSSKNVFFILFNDKKERAR
jgi:hypothetical protein